jgi:succinate-semialdehyde dehydrogenase/glutarate-semialdehyde dehydrogenase
MGARMLHGGKGEGAYFKPTLLTNISTGMPVFHEEVFGPVFSVIKAKADDELIDLVNNSRFGLGASVFTSNRERADNFIRNIKDGAVFINGMVKSDPRLPFGGTWRSGYGRELSRQGILEFVNCKTVHIRAF